MAGIHTGICPAELFSAALQSSGGSDISDGRASRSALQRELVHLLDLGPLESGEYDGGGISMARVYPTTAGIVAREMGVGSQRLIVGLFLPCRDEVAIPWDVAEHAAHGVDRSAAEEYVGFCICSHRR